MRKGFKRAVRKFMNDNVSECVDPRTGEVNCTLLAESAFAALEREHDLQMGSDEEDYCFELAAEYYNGI